MKKVFICMSLIVSVAFVSCKKDRTCSCSYSMGGVEIKEDIKLYKVSDKTAKKDCTNQPLTISDSTGYPVTVSQTCVLK
jgi:hypothetical protein